MVVLEDSIDDLSIIDFNDATSSFIITGGEWTIFESPGYTFFFQREITLV